MSRARLTLVDRRTGEVTFEGCPVTRRKPCPVCGHPRHKPQGWCLRDEAHGLVICPHSESGLRLVGDAGWLHRVDGGGFIETTTWAPKYEPPAVTIDAAKYAQQFQDALGDAQAETIAGTLGVGLDSLGRLGFGYDAEHDAVSFPMRNAYGEIVGIRLRGSDGSKWAVRGSRQGIFYPHDREPQNTVLLCEGPTDTAALLDLGFDAVGRPSCNSGNQIVADLLARQRRVSAVVVADHDGPGEQGAHTLADLLIRVVDSVKVIEPLRAKDAREWRRKGATRALVETVIHAAPLWQPQQVPGLAR